MGSLSLLGFERSYIYTGEEKGGLDPYEEDDLLRRPLPLSLLILISPIHPQGSMNPWIYLLYLL